MMACHLDQLDTCHPKRLCVGWLANVGPTILASGSTYSPSDCPDVPSRGADQNQVVTAVDAVIRLSYRD
jgi:hypothetical protein